MFNFFKKDNAIEKAKSDIKNKYQTLMQGLQGTDEEKEALKKALESQLADELAGVEDAIDAEVNPGALQGKKVKVEFVVKQFQFEGKIYSASDIEQAASEGDKAAVDFINQLLDMKSGVVKQVPVND